MSPTSIHSAPLSPEFFEIPAIISVQQIRPFPAGMIHPFLPFLCTERTHRKKVSDRRCQGKPSPETLALSLALPSREALLFHLRSHWLCALPQCYWRPSRHCCCHCFHYRLAGEWQHETSQAEGRESRAWRRSPWIDIALSSPSGPPRNPSRSR